MGDNRTGMDRGAAVKERPILFSAPMIKPILADTKTQTRRIINPQPTLNGNGMIGHEKLAGLFAEHVFGYCMARMVPSPYGAPGDRLWVREAWRTAESLDDVRPINLAETVPIRYEADSEVRGRLREKAGRQRPGIHMPRRASRVTLEVTSIRVERLHAITDEDAKAEGVEPLPFERKVYPSSQAATVTEWSHRAALQLLWESINGAESWRSNPWVWVVGFKRVVDAG